MKPEFKMPTHAEIQAIERHARALRDENSRAMVAAITATIRSWCHRFAQAGHAA